MSQSAHRISALAEASNHLVFAEHIGIQTEKDLRDWLTAELGRPDALDKFAAHGNILTKAQGPDHILHIVSSNTPHAALQSLFRGLILGSKNTVKLPSSGIAELTQWTGSLPDTLRSQIELIKNLDDFHWPSADAVIAIGSDATIQAIQSRILPHQTFIPHGHKISISIVTSDFAQAAQLAAQDASLFDQRGCLSLHTIYVSENAPAFAESLAREMAAFSQQNPPPPRTLSEAGAIHNFRQSRQFTAANTDTIKIWQSPDSQDWTVLYQQDPTLTPSCLGRCVTVSPLPDPLTTDTLGSQSQHLSTIALHPFTTSDAEKLTHLPAHRICPLGQSQQPSLFWHHDAFAPLASLVRWKDLG